MREAVGILAAFSVKTETETQRRTKMRALYILQVEKKSYVKIK